MSQREPAPGFGTYLTAAIERAGYRSPTAFARALEVDPSVVLRWIQGRTQPTPALLVRAVPLLGLPVSDLIEQGLGIPAETPEDDRRESPMPPIAVKVAWLVGDDSPLSERERATCEAMLGKVVDMFWPPTSADD